MEEAAKEAAAKSDKRGKEVSQVQARESQSLLERAKGLQRDDVIIEYREEVVHEASQVKAEESRDSSSSGMHLVGPPTNMEPAAL
eukprot:4661612-Karenia_brevis.AAC.1